jgi:riboflavin synthase
VFTGIVEEVGTVRGIEAVQNGRRLTIGAHQVMVDAAIGDSIAVDGVCQTIVERTAEEFVVQAIATTLGRTTLGDLGPGDVVNLERPLAAGARLGGHFVQGHVDAVGTVRRVEREGEHVLLDVETPAVVREVTVLHGSIAMHGVSLTVNALSADDVVQVALIPHTWMHTNLHRLVPGSRINLEGDLLGRFVVEYLKRRGGSGVL